MGISLRTLAVVLVATSPLAVAAPAHAQISFGLSIRIGYAPPALPVYVQPPIPAPDYLWVPGFWSWSDDLDDYYWVPGHWVQPPRPGLLWTPAWWGWENGFYGFHPGYWAPHIGFYGGINYGFGYFGSGWQGGYWRDNHVVYNRAVTNITNVHVTNVYNQTVIHNTVINRVSYNGPGGVAARPTQVELAAAHEPHLAPTPVQVQHAQAARQNPAFHAAALAPNWHPPAVRRVNAPAAPVASHPAGSPKVSYGNPTPVGAPAPAYQREQAARPALEQQSGRAVPRVDPVARAPMQQRPDAIPHMPHVQAAPRAQPQPPRPQPPRPQPHPQPHPRPAGEPHRDDHPR